VSRRLLAVVAHPDDDTFACSGTVALHADEPGFRFALVHVTSGEGGMISDPSLATRANLGAVREDEDRRSWVALGRVPDRHEFLRYPDGGVADAPFDELVERIAAILREERPDVVITFDPKASPAMPITSRWAGRRPRRSAAVVSGATVSRGCCTRRSRTR
jgi:N-acetyl-1-D-myo-inositol-2-amino-2-deoxy-alpha-D-glucopyranoside deacetylase